MDQIKIGKFIAAMRKEKGLTQRQLAEKLLISDKTVSKWERGNGMPEVSLMMPLCEALGINLNELFSGEKLTDADYRKKAEENMMDLVKEKEESKQKLILSLIEGFTTLLAAFTIILLAGLLEMEDWLRVLLLVIAFIVIAGGLAVAGVLDMKAGTFECRHCGARFTPTAGAYLKGAHTITTRRLKCPACGRVSYCKHRLTH